MTSVHETVSSLLSAVGLELSPEETVTLVASYPKLRAAVDLLYEVAVHDEEPILVFRHDTNHTILPATIRASDETRK